MSIAQNVIGIFTGVFGIVKTGQARAWTAPGTFAVMAGDTIAVTFPASRNVTFVVGGNGSKLIFRRTGLAKAVFRKAPST
jgi:hypothetical protein